MVCSFTLTTPLLAPHLMVLLNVPAVEMVFVRSRYISNAYPVECIVLTFSVYHMQCSYCHKDDCIAGAAQDETFCLTETDNGIELKRIHAYHYQVIVTSSYVLNYNLECINMYTCRFNAKCFARNRLIAISCYGQRKRSMWRESTLMSNSGWRIWLYM